MDKRYQVFLSSTYVDLAEERGAVMQTLVKMDCIPAGMELFPAIDEEQFTFIKRVIDDCDYYIVIIGGRYGSLTSEGLSYTEKEYDYAVEKGLKIVGLVHDDPDAIPYGKSEQDPVLRQRLADFKAKVKTGRLVSGWKQASELPALVSFALIQTMKLYPGTGWVRGDQVASREVLDDINQLRKANEDLVAQVKRLTKQVKSSSPALGDLAPLSDFFTVGGTYRFNQSKYPWSVNVTWQDIFALIAPYLLEHPNDLTVKSKMAESLFRRYVEESNKVYRSDHSLNDQVFQTIKIQMTALKLIELQYSQTVSGGMALFWSLTDLGNATLLKTRTIRATP